MVVDASKEDLLIGVCGAGAMGRGIVQVASVGGVRVKVFDINKEQLEGALKFIDNMLGRAVEKGRMEEKARQDAISRIELVGAISDLSDCEIVIEAATENLEIKKKIFAEIEDVVSDSTIIATNTSSLSVTTIASACKRPERIAGFHFFNPVPLMKLVEVIEVLVHLMSKRITLKKYKTQWVLITDDMILVSAHQSDKDYMLRYIENWKQRHV